MSDAQQSARSEGAKYLRDRAKECRDAAAIAYELAGEHEEDGRDARRRAARLTENAKSFEDSAALLDGQPARSAA